MQTLTQNSENRIVFLLVAAVDQSPLAEAEQLTLALSAAGEPFATPDVEIDEIGAGWYSFDLPADYTLEIGPLIVRATAKGSMEWRDIYYIEPPTIGGGLTRADIEEIVAEEMAAWSARLLVPIEFIRIGAAG